MAWSKVDIYAFSTWTSINNDSETKQTKQIIEYQSVFFAICYFDREDRFRHLAFFLYAGFKGRLQKMKKAQLQH